MSVCTYDSCLNETTTRTLITKIQKINEKKGLAFAGQVNQA
jgi:hypothetical protein